MKTLKIQKLKNNLENAVLEVIADGIAKKENTSYTQAYKDGLITPLELINNSKMKGLYI